MALMRRPGFDPAGLREPAAWEYALRFAFGGVVTVATGVVATHYGPAIGGMFLAFPAILPATLTLVTRHDGRQKAVDDARGARLGAIGLAAFAGVVALAAGHMPAYAVLALATCAWTIVSVAAWFAARRAGAA